MVSRAASGRGPPTGWCRAHTTRMPSTAEELPNGRPDLALHALVEREHQRHQRDADERAERDERAPDLVAAQRRAGFR